MSLSETQTAYQSGEMTKPAYIDAMHAQHARLFEYAAFLHNTDIARIEISDGQVIMQTRRHGIRLMCDPADKRVIPVEILNFGAYEVAELDMLLRLLQNRMTIFDIGANVGWYSLNIAKAFPESRILAFEPIPPTFAYLKQNLALNQISNVQPFNIGLSDRQDTLTFHFHPEGSGSASSADLMGTGTAQKIQCPVQRLDDFVAETKQHVDFIKCDVEGAELFVFSGGIETIRRCTPIIFTEMLRKWAEKFNYHPNQIIDLLAGLGYRCFTIHPGWLVELQKMGAKTVETNFLFLHATAHAAQIRALARAPESI